jgi:hypothetical protein
VICALRRAVAPYRSLARKGHPLRAAAIFLSPTIEVGVGQTRAGALRVAESLRLARTAIRIRSGDWRVRTG